MSIAHIALIKTGKDGKITIPSEIREFENIMDGDFVKVTIEKLTKEHCEIIEEESIKSDIKSEIIPKKAKKVEKVKEPEQLNSKEQVEKVADIKNKNQL